MTDYEVVDILYAEDSQTDAELTLRALRKINLGNNLLWMKDGQEALNVLLNSGPRATHPRSHPRLILLDLKMPKVDGLEVLRVIRSTEALRAIPVVLITSSAEEIDIVNSYNLGVNSYVVKPIDSSSFSSLIAQIGYYWMVLNQVPGRSN